MPWTASFLWPQNHPQLKIHHQVGMACVFYGLNALTEQLEETGFLCGRKRMLRYIGWYTTLYNLITYIYIIYIWHIDIRDIYRQLEMWYIIVRKCRSYIICPIQDHTVSNRDMVSWFEYDMWNHATPYSTFFCETVKHPHLRMTCSSLWYMDVIPKPICNACAPTCRYLGIYTMSPPNHKKQRFWPPKNQVIYHKNL